MTHTDQKETPQAELLIRKADTQLVALRDVAYEEKNAAAVAIAVYAIHILRQLMGEVR